MAIGGEIDPRKKQVQPLTPQQQQSNLLQQMQEQGTQERRTLLTKRRSDEAAFNRVKPYLNTFTGDLQQGDGDGMSLGLSEAEKLMIEAAERTRDQDLNRLADVRSEAGILQSGSYLNDVKDILGSTRAGIATGLAGFAESAAQRRYNREIAREQMLGNLLSSILSG